MTLLPGCQGAGAALAERENLRLLATIPGYPGSVVLGTRTSAVRERGGDLPDPLLRVAGYVTTASLEVPRGTRLRDLRTFYGAALRGWRCSTWLETQPPPVWTVMYVSCRRGRARFALGTENLLPAQRLELAVAAWSPA